MLIENASYYLHSPKEGVHHLIEFLSKKKHNTNDFLTKRRVSVMIKVRERKKRDTPKTADEYFSAKAILSPLEYWPIAPPDQAASGSKLSE